MFFEVVSELAEIPASDWNALGDPGANPFLGHAFLSGLEATGCVSEKTGWVPQHLLVYADASRRALLGAVPMYLKTHSYGEYVFDWSWADAYRRAGLDYYPKLLAAIPFTPVTGPRLLTAEHSTDRRKILDALAAQSLRHARQLHASSLHWLFTDHECTETLRRHELMVRVGNQFHWHNIGYRNFDEFLLEFTARNRKKIKRERRRVREAGITMQVLHGSELAPKHWDAMYRFYQSTVMSHGAYAYLKRDFFDWIGSHMADQVVVVTATSGARLVAGALNFRGTDTLFGRYWGALRDYNGLHFETCYYSTIEYCIEHGLQRFEAGAQGRHKLNRGLLPRETRSAHWLDNPQFAHAVADFLRSETHELQRHTEELHEHFPYRQGTAGDRRKVAS